MAIMSGSTAYYFFGTKIDFKLNMVSNPVVSNILFILSKSAGVLPLRPNRTETQE